MHDRQTDSFDWDTNPHTPRLYCKPAPPLLLPRHTDLLGLHRLITGMEKVLMFVLPYTLQYYVSSENQIPRAPATGHRDRARGQITSETLPRRSTNFIACPGFMRSSSPVRIARSSPLSSSVRQTDSFRLGHEPTHPPTLFQAGSASASPTSAGKASYEKDFLFQWRDGL